MCHGKELTEGQKGGIITAKKLGHTPSEISRVIGCSRSSVLRVLATHESQESPKQRTGRPRILNAKNSSFQ
jgi:transposase